ncbi:hypothetical protein JCM5353_001074 [Sporobolomyces roseus]
MAQDPRVPVCFDVLGTCYSFDGATEKLLTIFPDLSKERADDIVQDWFHSAQRDFTYLSMNDSYAPIAQVLKSTLPRIYLMHKLVSSPDQIDSKTMIDPIISSIPSMPPRPSLIPATKLLASSKSPKFRLMAATNGGLETTKKLFTNAMGEDLVKEMAWEFFSCDQDKKAKPDQKVYSDVWKALGKENEGERKGWFVASHTWDLHAAKRAGFKTAYVTYEEHLVLEDLFGKPDIVAKDLEEAAKRIIEAES